jgi:hypothetical protein
VFSWIAELACSGGDTGALVEQRERRLVFVRGRTQQFGVIRQVMISKRPSACSASAVQLSTQSPQFM